MDKIEDVQELKSLYDSEFNCRLPTTGGMDCVFLSLFDQRPFEEGRRDFEQCCVPRKTQVFLFKIDIKHLNLKSLEPLTCNSVAHMYIYQFGTQIIVLVHKQRIN